MTVTETLERVFRDMLGFDGDITDATTSADIDNWDSLAHVTLMFSIEQEFGVHFNGEEFARLESVGELRLMIERKLDVSSSGN